MLTALLLASCSGGRDVESPLAGSNVILIVADALRADRLGVYGYARPTSPEIDAFAKGAVVFESATSASSQTVPSVVSLLSGLYPHHHGNQYFPSTNSIGAEREGALPSLSETPRLLAEAFSELGYQTVAVVANPWLRPEYGFKRGFEDYLYLEPGGSDYPYARGNVLDLAAELILEGAAEDPNRPLFLYLHYMDVHAPYWPDEPERDRLAAGVSDRYFYFNGYLPEADPKKMAGASLLYDAEVRTFDGHLRQVLASIENAGLSRDTLVVVTSDHGDEFHEHGGMGHGSSLYEEVVHVPLLLAHPKLKARRISVPVTLVDLMPTLLTLLGAEPSERLDGISLAGLVFGRDGESLSAERTLLSELGDLKLVRSGNRKLLFSKGGNARTGAFDLAEDPLESRSLLTSETAPKWLDRFVGAAEPLFPGNPVFWPPDGEPLTDPKAQERMQKQLRALGYSE